MNTDLKALKHRSSVITDGLGRAAARPYLRSVGLSDEEIRRRLKEWKPAKPCYKTGALARYAKLVSSASEGAITQCGS